jgi:predicted nucleotidyltransferase
MSMKTVATVRRWAGDSRRWTAAFLRTAPLNNSIVAIVAMGSAVRERGHRRSDFDLLVIYRGPRPLIKSPVEVDIRLVGLERIDDYVASGHEVVGWALKFGIPLYDPLKVWQNLRESWQDQIPLPSPTQATERAQNALARAKEMLEIGDESAADDLVLAAMTQFARVRLIRNGIYPASRPELPDQLRQLNPDNPLADWLERAMYGESSPDELIRAMTRLDL